MRYAKMLGLLVIAAAALMAFAGVASATTLTSPAGSTYTSTIKAASEGNTSLHNASIGVTVTCQSSTVEGKVEKHGSGVTVTGAISTLTFAICGTDTVTVVTPGSLEIHHITGTNNGTVTSTGAEITIKNGSTGVSCTYRTNGTDIGTLTGGSTATLDIASSIIPRNGDSILCGSKGEWTGSYIVNTPDTLLVNS